MASSTIAHSIPFRDNYMANNPNAVFYENFPSDYTVTDNAIGTTGLITAMAIPLYGGDVITKASILVGATAGATLTHKYFALYSTATVPALLGQQTDDTGAAMAANTIYTGTFATPITVPSTGLYWAAFCVTGTTIPTLVGRVTGLNATSAGALNVFTGRLGVSVTATGAASTAPATMASLTNLAVVPWVCLQ